MDANIEIDWLISDSHFWHQNIVKYCLRPGWFEKDYEKHNDLMWSNWVHMVRPHETILHLGDLCFWKKNHEASKDREEMLRQLPGNKFIILGNHDKYPTDWYEDVGFTVVEPFSREVDGHTVHFDHYPTENLREDEASIHGHVHSNPYTATNRHLNCSVEVWGYSPIPYDTAVNKSLFSTKS